MTLGESCGQHLDERGLALDNWLEGK
jgi:hypothetical protein